VTLPLRNPFPFWLYGSDRQYLMNSLSSRSVAFAWRRIRLASGMVEASDPSGYWNYELGRVPAFAPPRENRPTVDLSPAPASEGLRFPGLDHIAAALAAAGPDTRIVFVIPPIYHTGLPAAHSSAANQITACKYDLQQRAAQRRGALLDFLLDAPLTRDPANFWDHDHMRSNLARIIEAQIGEALRGLDSVRN
jgi:hypothetical protein